MEISGEFHIPANKKTVWDGLNNPEILSNLTTAALNPTPWKSSN